MQVIEPVVNHELTLTWISLLFCKILVQLCPVKKPVLYMAFSVLQHSNRTCLPYRTILKFRVIQFQIFKKSATSRFLKVSFY